MFAAGVLNALITVRLFKHRIVVALALAGIASVALMSAMNFALDSDYRWVILLPALLWITGIARHFSSTDFLAPSPCPVNFPMTRALLVFGAAGAAVGAYLLYILVAIRSSRGRPVNTASTSLRISLPRQ